MMVTAEPLIRPWAQLIMIMRLMSASYSLAIMIMMPDV